ncbi:hypothetical protein SLA2020_081030 [Shorea laevis]
MLLLIANHIQRLWDSWNIRGLIILSLFLQSFLVLSAPLRKQRGGKWIIMIPLWLAYLLADWVATFTIGLMLRGERSDILALWAPFLLLHLGGPDTITSFSLEDNEFWIRHLLGLILQVGSTIYVILQSLTHTKLLLPTLLVLIAGIIKYAERNHAFYLASFDHFGKNWAYQSHNKVTALPPIPVQFEQAHRSWFEKAWGNHRPSIVLAAACTVGTIKSLLVGPPMTKEEETDFCYFMREKLLPKETLQTIEVQLNLLYGLLHTKLPVVDSKTGYICRAVNFGCVFGALVSFSISLNKHYHNKLGGSDICLTYALLIGALALDLISIRLLMSSDWIMISHYSEKKNYGERIQRRRWSNLIPQLNIFLCRFKNKDGDHRNTLVNFFGTSSLFETIRRRILCVSHENFVEEQVWQLIFTTLQEKGIGVAGTEIFGPSGILTSHITNLAWTLKKFEHMDSLLIWHIATEICHRNECQDNSPSSSTSTSNNPLDYQKICKLISDYMFYLLVMEPTMTATSTNNLKLVFEDEDPDEKWKWSSYWKKGSKEVFTKDLEEALKEEHQIADIDLVLLKKEVNKLDTNERRYVARFSRINAALLLAKELQYQPGRCPWKLMSRFWVEILCRAAIRCQPIVHARQVSTGGQLLTLVWLLINYLGLTPPSINLDETRREPNIKVLKSKVYRKRHRRQSEDF